MLVNVNSIPKLAARFPSGAQLPDSQALIVLNKSKCQPRTTQLFESLRGSIHVTSGTQKTSRGNEICGEVLDRGGDFTEKNRVAGNPKRCANDERKEALVVLV